MPWTPGQVRLFQAAAHNPAIAQAHGIPVQRAATMASVGIKATSSKPKTKAQVLAKALTSMKGTL